MTCADHRPGYGLAVHDLPVIKGHFDTGSFQKQLSQDLQLDFAHDGNINGLIVLFPADQKFRILFFQEAELSEHPDRILSVRKDHPITKHRIYKRLKILFLQSKSLSGMVQEQKDFKDRLFAQIAEMERRQRELQENRVVVDSSIVQTRLDQRAAAQMANAAPAQQETVAAEETQTAEAPAMEKTLNIEGMMCTHCEARVKKALEALEGVASAAVSHESGTAVVTLSADVPNDVLTKAVEDQDYKVLGID